MITVNRKARVPAWLFAAGLCISAPAAMANCEKPEFNANIPDGKNASQQQMDEVYSLVSGFVKEGESYIECVETSEGSVQARRIRDSMLDDMERVAAQFNRQLRSFRRANS